MLGTIGAIFAAAGTCAARNANIRETDQTDGMSYLPLNDKSILLAYAAYGVGSTGYMTFMVAYLNAEGNPVWRVSVFWTAIGVAAMLAPWIWPRLLQKRNPVTGFATLVGINAFATALPIFITSFPGAISSALIFGSTFFAVVSSTTEYVRRNCQKPQHTAAIGAFTLAFGIGQTSGPFLIGRITDYCGSLSAGLLTGTALIAISAILSISQLPNRNVTSPPT